MSIVDRGFDIALSACEMSDAPRTGLRMGAALLAGSRVLSLGANLYQRSHPDSHNDTFVRSLHAEHAAICRRKHYPSIGNLTLYVARKRADGSIGSSKPCNNCMRLCRVAGIRRVRYFDEHGNKQEIVL